MPNGTVTVIAWIFGLGALLFAPIGGEYAVFRMTYRGDGGWSWALDHGRLGSLLPKYLNKLGTSAFFELY